MELVYMDGKKEPYTLSSIIADCANISHHAVQEHIRKQQKGLNVLGRSHFKCDLYQVDSKPKIIF